MNVSNMEIFLKRIRLHISFLQNPHFRQKVRMFDIKLIIIISLEHVLSIFNNLNINFTNKMKQMLM